MIFFKSLFNGIGTGSGMSWPLFGIVFSIVGASIGGLFSLAFGSFALGLFITVSCSIFYLSYQRMIEEQQVIQKNIQKNEQKLREFIDEYINVISKEYQISSKKMNFDSYLATRQQISLINDQKSSLYQALLIVKAVIEHPSLEKNSIPREIKEQIKKQYTVPYSKTFIPTFLAFVGTFGSIAGFSAGFSGLLTGLGLFGGFAAFPIIGLSILGVGFALAVFAASIAYIDAQETSKNQYLSQTLKSMYQDLKKHVFDLSLPLFKNETNFSASKPPRNFPSLFKMELCPEEHQNEPIESQKISNSLSNSF